MFEEWEDVKNVPSGTTVFSQGLERPIVVVGKVVGQRDAYILDQNLPVFEGRRSSLTINRKKIRVRRIPLLPKP